MEHLVRLLVVDHYKLVQLQALQAVELKVAEVVGVRRAVSPLKVRLQQLV
jgi:hypothetical protein